jgi:hypothetical protein
MATAGVEESGAPFLPYFCEKLRTKYLLPPCANNLARIKALRAKWPEAHIGPLEHCLDCRGKDLVTREAPAAAGGDQSVDGSIDSEPVVQAPEKMRKLSFEKIAQASGYGQFSVNLVGNSPDEAWQRRR